MSRATDIAIISMAGRYPKSDSPGQLWQHLVEGDDLSTNATHADKRIGRHFPIEGIAYFDHAFFGFTPYEAQVMDPQHRILLTCAHQAMEQAGYDKVPAGMRVGVFASASISTYLISVVLNSPFFNPTDLNYAVLLGNDKDTLATKISYKLNLTGPAVAVQCACSSSLVATHVACQSLLLGDADMCIVGAASLTVPQDRGYTYKEGGILSRDGYCRPFDRDASGTVKGNGCSVLVLRRLADAERDGDAIHAVIRGTAINNDGSEKIGYTAPSITGQQQVITEALSFAHMTASEIDYIETHGTGTELGDQIELTALASVFRQSAHKIPLGSLKANIGHLDVAAGITSIIKGVHAMRTGIVPAIQNLRNPTQSVAEATARFEFPQKSVFRPLRTASVSSFGIGGTNAHAVLERYDAKPRPAMRALPAYLVPVSVNKQEDFAAYARNIERSLEAGVPLLDLAATLVTRCKRRAIVRCFVVPQAECAAAVLRGKPVPASADDLRIPRFSYQALRTIIAELPCIASEPADASRGVEECRTLYVQLLATLGVLGVPNVAEQNGFPPLPAREANAEVKRFLAAKFFAGNACEETPDFPPQRLFEFLASVHTLADLSLGVLYRGTNWRPTAVPAYPLRPVRHWIDAGTTMTATIESTKRPAAREALHDDEILKKILTIWRELVGDEEITVETTLWDSGADSLTAVEILARVNQTFGTSISFTSALSDQTPRDMTALVLGREFRSSTPWLTNVRFRSAQAKTIFLLHPAGGSTFCYRSLNRYLSDDLNLWSIDLPEGYEGYTSLHALAVRYAESIRGQQPVGPYLLGGYSFGGNLAHEIASVLEAQGCEVETVFMFDSHPPEAYNVYDGSELDYVGAFPTMMASYFKPEHTARAIRESVGVRDFAKALEVARRLNLLKSSISDEDAARFFERWKFSHTLLKAHEPATPISANLVLFIAREEEPILLLESLKINKVCKRQWETYFLGSMNVVDVDGDHFTMFSMSRHVKQLAGHFQAAVKAMPMPSTITRETFTPALFGSREERSI